MTPVIAKTIKYVTLAMGSIVALLPLTVILMASLKTQQELEQGGPFDFPSSPQWGNYATFFVRGRALEGFMNTGIILVFSILGTIIIGTMAAYAIDRFEFRFRKSIVMLFLLATLVPGVTTQVATFQVVHALGAYNTRVAPILLFMGTDIISIYIFIQFMRGIPKELAEAESAGDLNRAVPGQGAVCGVVAGHLGRYHHRRPSHVDHLPAAAAPHLQRPHPGRSEVAHRPPWVCVDLSGAHPRVPAPTSVTPNGAPPRTCCGAAAPVRAPLGRGRRVRCPRLRAQEPFWRPWSRATGV